MDRMSFIMNPFMGDIKFGKLPLKYSCLLVPFFFLSFVFSAAASVVIGFATEWDIGVRYDAKRKFYEYYSLAAVGCFLSVMFLFVFARTILFGCIYKDSRNTTSSENSSENISSSEDSICCALTIFISIYGGGFAAIFVLFGLIMDEVIKIPTFVLTIIGAVFEGIIILKSCCTSCCCTEKDDGCCFPFMKLLADLIDLAMFILWTIKLAVPSFTLPFTIVGILKVVASVLSTISDIATSVKSKGCSVSLVLVSLCSSTGVISQSLLFPLRADGYITIHYAWCSMVVAVGFTLFALVVLVSVCCGYTILMYDDEDYNAQRVEAVEGE